MAPHQVSRELSPELSQKYRRRYWATRTLSTASLSLSALPLLAIRRSSWRSWRAALGSDRNRVPGHDVWRKPQQRLGATIEMTGQSPVCYFRILSIFSMAWRSRSFTKALRLIPRSTAR